MRVDLFDFDLPEDRIALRPAHPRDAARLMVVEPGAPNRHVQVRDLPGLLRSGDVLVVNNTRVLHAALEGTRTRGDSTIAVHVNLAERDAPDTWWAFARPGKRIAVGDQLLFVAAEHAGTELTAEVTDKAADGRVRLAFDRGGPHLDETVAVLGHMPLPPYIAGRRAEDAADRTDYQTVFAEIDGAVAAPTAGLHFTPELMTRLKEHGVGVEAVTLHVGPGTFLPVKVDDTAGHRMHAEWGSVTEEAAAALNAARVAGGRIVAIGTTSLRLLETVADEAGVIHPFSEETDIFITPGYRFRAVDLLMTNFHLPRSTLFMLVSAFSGRERMLAAYREAIAEGYCFYSYGDACLLHPAPDVR